MPKRSAGKATKVEPGKISPHAALILKYCQAPPFDRNADARKDLEILRESLERSMRLAANANETLLLRDFSDKTVRGSSLQLIASQISTMDACLRIILKVVLDKTGA